jgi:lipopolysaccharide transport system permease protein
MMLTPSLIWELTKRDFSEQFAGSNLGTTWAVICPVVNLIIYTIIFGQVMGTRLPGHSGIYAYGVYVTVGLVPWIAFQNSLSRSTSVFVDKKPVISKVKTSLPALLIYISLSESITFIITMSLFMLFLLLTGYSFRINLLLVPFIYFLQQLFAFGFGLLAATLNVFIRDLKQLVGIVLQLWFWFTPIVYVRDILPGTVKSLIRFNPAYVIVESYQRIFVFNEEPAYRALIIMTVVTHLIIFASYAAFRALERDVRDFL